MSPRHSGSTRKRRTRRKKGGRRTGTSPGEWVRYSEEPRYGRAGAPTA